MKLSYKLFAIAFILGLLLLLLTPVLVKEPAPRIDFIVDTIVVAERLNQTP